MTVSFRRLLSPSLLFWLTVTLVGSYFLVHLKKYVNFGIDLVGGTYITLEVQLDKAVESDIADRVQALLFKLKKHDLEAPTIRVEKGQATLTFSTQAAATAAYHIFSEQQAYSEMLQQQGNRLVLTLPNEEIKRIKDEAVQSNITVLRRRLDPFGAGEITIAPQGDRNIIIELPNVHNPQQAKSMIGKAALLEIKVVEDSGMTPDDILAKYGGQLPEGTIIVPQKEPIVPGQARYYLVPSYTDITGKLLKDAHMDFGGTTGTQPVVSFTLKPEGAERFYELTSNNRGRQLAILIDGTVITAPVVNEAISAQGQISGSFTAESAQELAALLKSGAFAAPVTFEEERHIGPSLGQESIRQGLIACTVGLTLLLVFSIAIYKTAGLLAFIVLLYNILFILLGLAFLGGTLTLPGIAGMILTVGMAIDASILIYERIKEELGQGATLSNAVNTGFAGALRVILDANITHFLVALVLYKLGSGPIKGFAVTMIIGILSTLVTGLLLLRWFFNFFINNLGIQKIRI